MATLRRLYETTRNPNAPCQRPTKYDPILTYGNLDCPGPRVLPPILVRSPARQDLAAIAEAAAAAPPTAPPSPVRSSDSLGSGNMSSGSYSSSGTVRSLYDGVPPPVEQDHAEALMAAPADVAVDAPTGRASASSIDMQVDDGPSTAPGTTIAAATPLIPIPTIGTETPITTLHLTLALPTPQAAQFTETIGHFSKVGAQF
ncbi:hypothetical protein HYH02_010405 [Chlamydomonas schloesseri]|uniref:Uncharacterized protein n=1 Tax=Chlamydomonas schloesseri TaxID=2026947 RepID=A0A835T7U9_9CHLO|nr:hypothetical protein HYH02_010405 [Chlamydomonas schloesseri]|eukprot:KAG2440527.1 hypothetical protein HYH02_010405 [Chlamydomonas schloesseri]